MKFDLVFYLIYCLNCKRLKGINAFGYVVLFHRPCRVPVYDMHRVQYFIAPPGFVSGFMRGATRINVEGENFRIARVDEESFMEAWRGAKPGEVRLAPDPYLENTRVLLHRNILGAELRYALVDKQLFYKEDSGEDRFDSRIEAVKHLLECMDMAKKHNGPVLGTFS